MTWCVVFFNKNLQLRTFASEAEPQLYLASLRSGCFFRERKTRERKNEGFSPSPLAFFSLSRSCSFPKNTAATQAIISLFLIRFWANLSRVVLIKLFICIYKFIAWYSRNNMCHIWHWIQIISITVVYQYLLLAECEVRTASYGPSFFQFQFVKTRKEKKKRGSINLTYGPSKQG